MQRVSSLLLFLCRTAYNSLLICRRPFNSKDILIKQVIFRLFLSYQNYVNPVNEGDQRRVGSLGLSGEPGLTPGSPSRFRRDADASRRNRRPRLPEITVLASGQLRSATDSSRETVAGLPRPAARNRRLHCARPALRGTGERMTSASASAFPESPGLTPTVSPVRFRSSLPPRPESPAIARRRIDSLAPPHPAGSRVFSALRPG